MRLSPLEILSRLNSSYWFVPLIVTLAGMALAVLLIQLDSSTPLTARAAFDLLHPNTAEGAQALLSSVIGAMITALSVTFSVTIVALTVAAQHFGPRVLNNLVRHTSAQAVLGTFMATFAYAVLVLGAVDGEGVGQVPELAVSGAVILVVMSVGALIYYVHHIATSLQIGELTGEIAIDFGGSLHRLSASAGEAEREGPLPIPEAPPDAAPIEAVETGYIQRIDYATVVRVASAGDATVWIRREVGAFVIAGAPLALVHPRSACEGKLITAIRRACIVGRDRTLWHDPEFAVKQLVEVALRALSPGVNEPFTALTCIDRLAEGLAAALRTPEPPTSWRDAAGRPRVFAQSQPFPNLLRAAFDPIRIFAGGNPAIYARLLDSLAELILMATRPGDCRDLRHQAAIIRRTAERALVDPDDKEYVNTRYERALQQFGGEASTTRRE